ncbi:MAG: hypothetical protein ABII71_03715 [Candidatus Micrarchaeota archaeon]
MEEDECCKDECCSDDCCGEKGHEMPVMMMHMAHAAWNELMVEKMKAAFEKKNGARMEKAAQVAADHSTAFWNARMAGKELSEEDHKEYEKRLMEAFQG